MHERVVRLVGVAEDDSGTSFLNRIQSELRTIVREAEFCVTHFDDESFGYGLTPVVCIDVATHGYDRSDRGQGRQNVG